MSQDLLFFWHQVVAVPSVATRGRSNHLFRSFVRYMVTSGMDKKLKVFDIRAFKPLQSYFIPAGASCLSLSQRGLLSAATGDIVQVSIAFTLRRLRLTNGAAQRELR